MPTVASEPVGQTHRRYKRVQIFAAHEREGVVVDRPWLRHAASVGNMNEKAGRRYFVTLTHDSTDPVGWLENYQVDDSDVVIGEDFIENHPTMYADLVVRNDIADQIDAGLWPRRSCTANLSDGRIISCSLLDSSEDSWFGFADLGTPYGGVVAEYTDAVIACYARGTDMPNDIKKKPDEEYEDDAKKKDEEAYEDDSAEKKDGEPTVEQPAEEKPAEEKMNYEGDAMASIEAKLDKLIAALMPESAETAPDNAGGDMYASKIVKDAVAEYHKANYSTAWPAAKKRLEDANRIVDYNQAERLYQRVYTAAGNAVADQVIDEIIKTTRDLPGGPPNEQAAVNEDVKRLQQLETDERAATIKAAIASGIPETDAIERAAKYKALSIEYAASGAGTTYPITLIDYLKYGE